MIIQATPNARRIISGLCDVASMPKREPDAPRLRKLARNAGPRWVEAWMRGTNPEDLTKLDDQAFKHELVVALNCIERQGEAASEALADKLGIPEIE